MKGSNEGPGVHCFDLERRLSGQAIPGLCLLRDQGTRATFDGFVGSTFRQRIDIAI